MVFASNALFIRKGLSELLLNNDFDVIQGQFFNIKYKEDTWSSKVALCDNSYLKYMNSMGFEHSIGGQFDGNIYSKELFEKMALSIKDYFEYDTANKGVTWEEVLFSTYIYNLVTQRRILYKYITHMDWENGLNVTINDIESSKEYAIKRIPRKINDYTRMYIRKKYGYDISLKKVIDDSRIVHGNICVLKLYEMLKNFKRYIIVAKNFLINSIAN